MRKLLLAALGAAGSLLIELPALAQISNTTSTFTGDVAASCEFSLPENLSMGYVSRTNSLNGGYGFGVTTNSSVIRMGVSEVTVIKEPPPRESSIVPEVRVIYVKGNMTYTAYGSKNVSLTSGPLSVSASALNSFSIVGTVKTSSQVNTLYQLPPGEYSYRVTITCLQ